MREGLQKQQDAWKMIEKAADSGGVGSLLSLLIEATSKKDNEPTHGNLSSDNNPEPISVKKPNGKYYYKCPICVDERMTSTRNGMKAHIAVFHTKRVMSCPVQSCAFTCYNPDIFNRHMTQKHSH